MSSTTKRRQAVRYPGKLNEKLEPLTNELVELGSGSEPDAVFSERDQSELDESLDRLGAYLGDPMSRPEYDEKFDLLCDYYSIEPDSPVKWRMLALALAIDHVPGFQEKPAGIRGRKKGMESALEVALRGRFVELTGSGLSERGAARIVANEFGRKIGRNLSAKAVLARVKRFEPIWRDHVRNGNDRPNTFP